MHRLKGLGILDFHLNCPMLLMGKQAQRQEPESGRHRVKVPDSSIRQQIQVTLLSEKVPGSSKREHTSADKEEGESLTW